MMVDEAASAHALKENENADVLRYTASRKAKTIKATLDAHSAFHNAMAET